MTKSWRDVHGHFVVTVRRRGVLTAVRNFDTDKEVQAFVATCSGDTTVTRIEGTHTDFRRRP